MLIFILIILCLAAAGRQEVIQPPPLSYKKWGFHEHDKLYDCEAAGKYIIILLVVFNK